MKLVFLMMMGFSVLMAEFIKKDDVVRDTKDALLWQDNSAVESKTMLYGEAKAYCKQLVLAGHKNWRLPTVIELQNIVDLTRYDPAIKRGFHFAASERYWSSTLYADDADRAWDVDFKSGSTEHNRHSYDFYVRCVR
ncbi:MAG: DUF1566 domain-containing protein [Campylobacterota bacterium]